MSAESALKIDTSLAALPTPERERVALYGARLLFTEMKSRLALAAQELARFESKYGMTIAHLATHPYHKHVATQARVQPSTETNLEAVLDVIRENLSAGGS